MRRAQTIALEEGDFSCGSFEQKILMFDLYEKPFNFLMPDHRDRYRTILGSFLSILTFVLVLLYAGYKFGNLVNYEDYKLMKFEQENFYPMREPFTSDHGFMLAAGVSKYNGETEPLEDPEIGTVKIYKKTWDSQDINGNGGLKFEEIPTEPCLEQDFGGGDDSLFYETKDVSAGDL